MLKKILICSAFLLFLITIQHGGLIFGEENETEPISSDKWYSSLDWSIIYNTNGGSKGFQDIAEYDGHFVTAGYHLPYSGTDYALFLEFDEMGNILSEHFINILQATDEMIRAFQRY